ncbi:small ribosomal subunit protein bS20c-like [Primulina eburnea]|uniref:small ribosomal subunit protein bS20c-like n=1 Tax=Primulina eburnea TaxID=1245227 RepID=UPI003C6C4305
MAGAVMNCVSCCELPGKLRSLSLATAPNATSAALKPLGFSSNASVNLFSKGFVSLCPVQRPLRSLIVCDARTKKADSAAKRARQADKRRIYNKARKSEIRTRMKKALEAMEVLVKKTDAQAEEVLPIEKLIAEAYSAIDKAVKVGALHRNTGGRRKSRLARRKKAVEIHHGWYTPVPAAVQAA